MEFPELPIGKYYVVISNCTDIIHLICSLLADDLRSIYCLARCSRLYSSVALPALYSHLSKFPADYDDEDRLAEDPTAYTDRLTKWSSLWKTLAYSSLSPRTTINYAAALRVLNLRDLCSLMEEFSKHFGQTAREDFFDGGLEAYNKTRVMSVGKRNNRRFDWQLSADCLTDLIVKETRNVTTLIRQTTLSDHLHLWLQNTPLLESLQVFSGAPLGDDRVAEALVGCPNLRSLELYYWPPQMINGVLERSDVLLARLLGSMTGGLKRFVIKNGGACFSALALSALTVRHGKSLTELEVVDISPLCFYALAQAPEITNLHCCSIHVDDMAAWADGYMEIAAVSEFFARNTSLERLNVGILETNNVLGGALKSLHLKHLSITHISDEILPDSFWPSIASQASTLETLVLDHTTQFFELQIPPEEMLRSICLLHKLKTLTIATFYSLVRDSEVGRIVESCPNIEEISFASHALSDVTLQHLCKLQRLRIFNTR